MRIGLGGSMDHLKIGARKKRGDPAPCGPLDSASPSAGRWAGLGRWLSRHVWPYNAIFVGVTLIYWYFILHDVAMMQSFDWGWMLKIHIANSLGITAVWWHLAFVLRQTQKGRADQGQRRCPG